MNKDNVDFSKILCPRYGTGLENRLGALPSGIKLNPLLIEFGIQEYQHRLF
jgi:hypothetical protein